MKEKRSYSGPGLRTALEERLKQIAAREGVDLQRLRRQVAFDRFLSRLLDVTQHNWVLKGGYSMELRFQRARTTRDLDFTVRSRPLGDGDTLLDHLQARGAIEANDSFSFRVGQAMIELDAAPYGGARYPVEAIMAGRIFAKFHVDVGVGDVIIEPVERTTPRDWLGFAGIAAPIVPMISAAQQFAEKVHAYTLPRGAAANSRVRDLVDVVLLIRGGSLVPAVVLDALQRTFLRRQTHPLGFALAPPPSSWDLPFAALARNCDLELNCEEAFGELREFLKRLPYSE